MQDSPLQQCHICFSSMAITLADVGGTDTLLSTRGRFVGWPTLTDLWTCNAVSPALRNSCRCDVSLHHFQLLFKQSMLQRQQKLLGQMRRGQPTAIFVHPVLSPAIQSHTHTHTHLTALCPGLPGWAGTRKVKPICILLKQETVSVSGISWTICKSAPSSR